HGGGGEMPPGYHRHERSVDHHDDVYEDGHRWIPGGGAVAYQNGGGRRADQPDVRGGNRGRRIWAERFRGGGPFHAADGQRAAGRAGGGRLALRSGIRKRQFLTEA